MSQKSSLSDTDHSQGLRTLAGFFTFLALATGVIAVMASVISFFTLGQRATYDVRTGQFLYTSDPTTALIVAGLVFLVGILAAISLYAWGALIRLALRIEADTHVSALANRDTARLLGLMAGRRTGAAPATESHTPSSTIRPLPVRDS